MADQCAHPTPICVNGLTRAYGTRRGVIDLTFAVRPGEIFGFLGPNGAGKTTTIRLLMGLLRPGRGTARVFELDCWRDAARVKALVGFLPGDVHLYEHLRGDEFLDFFAAFRGGGDRARRRAVLDRLDLDTHVRIKQLSKGNRQKLVIAQALIHDAPLLILDEPSSGLDPLLQAELLVMLHEEQARGKTVFLSSHNLHEVERVANRAAIIREGRLIAIEDVARLKAIRERRVEVVLRAPVPPARFAALPGVRVTALRDDGRHVDLASRGDLRPLLALLSELPVEDLTVSPPDLESVFLHYYGAAVLEGQPAAPTSQEAA
jgi:ABC-2 type transport system ATP-binding protein